MGQTGHANRLTQFAQPSNRQAPLTLWVIVSILLHAYTTKKTKTHGDVQMALER
jgi:hypothetical protein